MSLLLVCVFFLSFLFQAERARGPESDLCRRVLGLVLLRQQQVDHAQQGEVPVRRGTVKETHDSHRYNTTTSQHTHAHAITLGHSRLSASSMLPSPLSSPLAPMRPRMCLLGCLPPTQHNTAGTHNARCNHTTTQVMSCRTCTKGLAQHRNEHESSRAAVHHCALYSLPNCSHEHILVIRIVMRVKVVEEVAFVLAVFCARLFVRRLPCARLTRASR